MLPVPGSNRSWVDGNGYLILVSSLDYKNRMKRQCPAGCRVPLIKQCPFPGQTEPPARTEVGDWHHGRHFKFRAGAGKQTSGGQERHEALVDTTVSKFYYIEQCFSGGIHNNVNTLLSKPLDYLQKPRRVQNAATRS